jgi:outer membrane protein OmpA-like peptidoglycan-associated protein
MIAAMHRGSAALLVLLAPTVAAADPTQLGAFLGPRIFSQHSALGYIDGEQAHPMLENGVAFGARVAKQFGLPWLFPELELAFSPTKTTTPMNAIPADIYWLDPRVQLRVELMPGRRVQLFVLAGGGAPIALSSKRATLNSGVIGEGYVGGGIRINTDKGFAFRADARFVIVPGENPPLIGYEAEVNIGIDIHLGEKHASAAPEVLVNAPPSDRDGDGILDANDKCPGRPEDMDGFEDADGCPDIDNDGDHVLDIADKCPMQPETFNGFEDDDGCPDTVPPDVESLKGTVEGLLYAEGETAVRDSAHKSIVNIAKIMSDHASIKVVLVGHTDDREAKAFATPEPGQPPPDIDSIATQLAHGRAEAVRQALVAAGVPEGRVVVEGVGAEDPVADNSTAKGRLANRRVEIKLFVPR